MTTQDEAAAEESAGRPEDEPGSGVMGAFGRQLKLLRTRAGLDRTEFGKRVGYAGQSVASFEQGRRIPQPGFIDKADQVLDAAETQQAGGAGDEAGAGGGGSEEKETKAPEKTAATAVQQLAAEDPSGRHICYRVYTTDQGWTDAVCDGETAGTEGTGAPLKAVNIAVAGTKGTSGGAFLHNPASTNGTGHYPDPGTSAVDGIDNYVGSTEKDAPDMLGFSISVDGGNGSVCHSGYVHNDAWLDLQCDDPETGLEFTYVGTHDNNSWIEAVKLMV